MSLGLRAAIAFALGAVLMLVFDETVTRVAGLALMLGGTTLAWFAIATPEFLERDAEE